MKRAPLLKLKPNEIQKALDYQHYIRDYVNRMLGTNYTTKEAMRHYDGYNATKKPQY